MTRHVRRLDHVSLRVGDLATSLGFYRDLLGIPVRAHGVLDGGGSEQLTAQTAIPFADLDLGSHQTLELLQLATEEDLEPADRAWPGRAHVSFVTDDVHAAHAALTGAAAPTSGAPTTMLEPGFWHGASVFYARDPDGHTIELVERPHDDR
jgi:catechol 2,3-dioxygenase-like lactoylglutathione lyase family enzyme